MSKPAENLPDDPAMDIRGLCEKTQKAHIRNVKHFASFLGRPPDTATPEDLRAYQLRMTQDGVSASTFNVRIISLRHGRRHQAPA
jgi:site-specific recombinase XerD